MANEIVGAHKKGGKLVGPYIRKKKPSVGPSLADRKARITIAVPDSDADDGHPLNQAVRRVDNLRDLGVNADVGYDGSGNWTVDAS